MDERNAKSRKLHDAPSDSLLHQQLCQHVSFKSLPPLGTKDSLEEIRKVRLYSEYPRRSILRSFLKAATFEKRPRRRLFPKKKNDSNDKNTQDLSKKSNTELNIHKMRHKFGKEKGFVSFDIQKFGRKIKNHFKKDNFEAGSSEVQTRKRNEEEAWKSKSDCHKKESESEITEYFQKLHIDEAESSGENQLNLLAKSDSVEMLENSTIENKFTLDLCDSDLSLKNEKMTKKLNIQAFYNQKSLDFCSGDDVQNCSSFPQENLTSNQSQILATQRRSVQWNREVDVVYYAGDTDGGKIVDRKREPLREEADQQARHKKFIDLVMRKNMFFNSKTPYFHESWCVSFHK